MKRAILSGLILAVGLMLNPAPAKAAQPVGTVLQFTVNPIGKDPDTGHPDPPPTGNYRVTLTKSDTDKWDVEVIGVNNGNQFKDDATAVSITFKDMANADINSVAGVNTFAATQTLSGGFYANTGWGAAAGTGTTKFSTAPSSPGVSDPVANPRGRRANFLNAYGDPGGSPMLEGTSMAYLGYNRLVGRIQLSSTVDVGEIRVTVEGPGRGDETQFWNRAVAPETVTITSTVPEPGSATLVFAGLAPLGLALLKRRRSGRAASAEEEAEELSA